MLFACGIVAVGGIMRAVPVVLPFRGSSLEDVAALLAEYIVSEAEVFVQDECPLGHPLLAVLALYIVRAVGADLVLTDFRL